MAEFGFGAFGSGRVAQDAQEQATPNPRHVQATSQGEDRRNLTMPVEDWADKAREAVEQIESEYWAANTHVTKRQFIEAFLEQMQFTFDED